LDKTDTANLADGHRIFVARRHKITPKISLGARNALRAVYTADPGKAKGPLLRLNNDIVSPLESIVVILIHRDAFDPPSAAPGRNHQAAAARQTIRGEFPTTVAGTRMGRELSSLPFKKSMPAKIHGTGSFRSKCA